MHESCGVFGIYAPGVDVARITFFGLYALQHRGQESAGIATADGKNICIHTAMGLVSHAFTEDELAQLPGHIAIGHTRYSTTGTSRACNAQPILVESNSTNIALAHNGNIVNSKFLRDELCQLGYNFATTTDSEIIANLITSSTERNPVDRIISLSSTVNVTQTGMMLFAESTIYEDTSITLSARGSRIDPI